MITLLVAAGIFAVIAFRGSASNSAVTSPSGAGTALPAPTGSSTGLASPPVQVLTHPQGDIGQLRAPLPAPGPVVPIARLAPVRYPSIAPMVSTAMPRAAKYYA